MHEKSGLNLIIVKSNGLSNKNTILCVPKSSIRCTLNWQGFFFYDKLKHDKEHIPTLGWKWGTLSAFISSNVFFNNSFEKLCWKFLFGNLESGK